jgi:hypothetical protein
MRAMVFIRVIRFLAGRVQDDRTEVPVHAGAQHAANVTGLGPFQPTSHGNSRRPVQLLTQIFAFNATDP